MWPFAFCNLDSRVALPARGGGGNTGRTSIVVRANLGGGFRLRVGGRAGVAGFLLGGGPCHHPGVFPWGFVIFGFAHRTGQGKCVLCPPTFLMLTLRSHPALGSAPPYSHFNPPHQGFF